MIGLKDLLTCKISFGKVWWLFCQKFYQQFSVICSYSSKYLSSCEWRNIISMCLKVIKLFFFISHPRAVNDFFHLSCVGIFIRKIIIRRNKAPGCAAWCQKHVGEQILAAKIRLFPAKTIIFWKVLCSEYNKDCNYLWNETESHFSSRKSFENKLFCIFRRLMTLIWKCERR